MRSVLVVAHDFPPFGGGGVLRVLKFIKYLPEFGWRPVILTVDSNYYPPTLLDHSLLSEIPTVATIYRTRTLMGPYSTSAAQPVLLNNTPSTNNLRPLLDKIVPQSMRVIQDHGFFWLPYALAKAQTIIPKENIELIFSSSPPHNIHLLGRILKKRYGLPWIADFRDGWTRTEMYTAKSPLRQRFDRMCEKVVVNDADQIICVTPQLVEDFHQDYPSVKSKTHLIYNGYDPEDFNQLTELVRDNNTFRLAHVGALSTNPSRTPEIILQAAHTLASKNADFKQKFKLEFIGPVSNFSLTEMIRAYGLEANCDTVGLIPHAKALEYMQRADVLLLLITYQQKFGDSGILAGKFGEYVATGNPILAIAPEGIAATLVREYDLGLVAPPNNLAAVEKALSELFYHWQNNSLKNRTRAEIPTLFNRHCSTEKLAELFTNSLRS